jgi:hypothetical protein
MWTWDQSAGALMRAGKIIASGYSGNGKGLNSPAMQGAVGVGPIPAGRWKMTELRLTGATTGPYTIVLEPEPGTDTKGRSAFRIHGDNRLMDHSASHGCIILPPAIRHQIWESGDHELLVIE